MRTFDYSMLVGGRKKKGAVQQTVDGMKPEETTEEYIDKCILSRDYLGAITFIEFSRDELNQPYTREIALWHGYCLFHAGQYSEAIECYEKLLKQDPSDTVLWLYIASCQFYNQDYEDARESALKGPQCDFRSRLFLHISHQLNDEQGLFQAHGQLVGTLENQLSLAAIHYMRSHYQDAIEIYQRFLLQNPEHLALNVYIGMCQFKLEQFEESNEAVDLYLSENSDSAVALNLKSCDYFRLYDANFAESQLLQIKKFSSAAYDFVDNIVAHNLCIFHEGVDAFKTLPKLVSSLGEARYNLAVMHMRENNAAEANEVLQDHEPIETNETILKGAVLLALGQANGESSQIEQANAIFQEIGENEAMKDTLQGRQCLASNRFIIGEYEEALTILQTTEEYLGELDEYNYNKGMTLCSLSKWAEAERYMLMVKNPVYTREIYYVSWLCRCYIKNRKPESAWNLYVDATSTEDTKTLLHIISSECFASGDYYYAMKAYDVLAKYEMDEHFKDGLIASAVGVFRGVLTQKESSDKLSEVITILSGEPAAAQVLQTIRQYAEEIGAPYDEAEY